MKRKIIALTLSALTVLSSFSFVSADKDKVEIAFKVGDSILKINGVDTEVETPYVAGEGVTLVPLRVITEAFGSQVDWEGETKTITLTYPDVNIVLQIGNIIASVNDHSETLLEAPALSENGVTMVPLRFISETFGAEVGYDNETQAILVTKEKVGDAQTVTGITEMSRTGDSYYDWSIDTPVQMKMTDRGLDGKTTEFTADDGSNLYIDVFKYTDDTLTPFDEEFSNIKDSFSGYTLTEAEKLTDKSGNQYMHFQVKDKDETIDHREFYGKDYTTYEVTAIIENSSDASVKDMIIGICESFRLGSLDADTYDLSTVENGMRTVKDDKYKFSFKIPADYTQYTARDTENEFTFISPNSDSNARVSLGIFSKTADTTAKLLAEKDRSRRIELMNPELSKISEVTGSDNGTYRYTHEIKGSSGDDKYTTDTFFEKGDYVYNITVTVDSAGDLMLSGQIISSLETEELDSSEIGKLLRNDIDDTTPAAKTIGSYSFSLPTSWKTVSSGQTSTDIQSGIFLNASTASMMNVSVASDNKYKKDGLRVAVNDFTKYMDESPKNKLTGSINYTIIDGRYFGHFTYEITDDDGKKTYATTYMTIISKDLFIATIYEKDIYYHKDGNKDLLNALETLEEK